MASTYSPLLRFELIGAGEQAGLWGNTTNSNLGTLVEQAIAGVTTITLTGVTTYTVSTTNGTPDEQRSAVLVFTGTPAASVTVNVPALQKLYVVRNGTGQILTFKTPAQIGGIALASGASMMIFCDGANVYSAVALAPPAAPPAPLPSGTVIDFAGAVAPSGFLVCNGATVNRSVYSDLFAAIGTSWGAGDGSTTFNLPNLQRRTTIGAGGSAISGPGITVGSTGGEEVHALLTTEMPAHNHVINIGDPGHAHGAVVTDPGHSHITVSGGLNSGSGAYADAAVRNNNPTSTSTTGISVAVSGSGTGITGSSNNTGSGGAHNIMQPTAVVNKIIKT